VAIIDESSVLPLDITEGPNRENYSSHERQY